jgi:hypothetical protein
MRQAVKLVAINALVLFIVFNVVIWTICLATSVHNVFRTSEQQTITRKALEKARLPNYASVDWALTHFREYESLDTGYVSYIKFVGILQPPGRAGGPCWWRPMSRR